MVTTCVHIYPPHGWKSKNKLVLTKAGVNNYLSNLNHLPKTEKKIIIISSYNLLKQKKNGILLSTTDFVLSFMNDSLLLTTLFKSHSLSFLNQQSQI